MAITVTLPIRSISVTHKAHIKLRTPTGLLLAQRLDLKPFGHQLPKNKKRMLLIVIKLNQQSPELVAHDTWLTR